MFGRNGAGSSHRAGDNGPRKSDATGERRLPSDTESYRTQAAIRAELTGSDTATALGLVAVSSSPVLDMCRKLLAAGFNANRSLVAYRGTTLALRVRSIGEAARLTFRTAGNGAPGFALDGPYDGAAASPVRKFAVRHVSERQRLPNRRFCESFSFEVNGLHFTATVSRFSDGHLIIAGRDK